MGTEESQREPGGGEAALSVEDRERGDPMIDLLDEGARLTDQFARRVSYLRVSVTDRCNLRCVYCMPEAGLPWIPTRDVLSFEEIETIVAAAASVGVRRVRITGGEPLVRPRLAELIARLRALARIEEIALSTNGLLLAEHAEGLAAAGLDRVNVSLDTLRPDRFARIARRPGLERVLAGIDAAIAAGLTPLKINCVVMRGENDDELAAFAEMTRQRAIWVRFIEVMPVIENVALQRDAHLASDEILTRLGSLGALRPVAGPSGNGPARSYAFDGALGGIGVISPLSHEYCDRCNRVRLTADGRLRLCLFGGYELDLRTPLRGGATRERLVELLQGSMLIKPERHHLENGVTASAMRAFSEIGG